jgi:hypothetical protein
LFYGVSRFRWRNRRVPTCGAKSKSRLKVEGRDRPRRPATLARGFVGRKSSASGRFSRNESLGPGRAAVRKGASRQPKQPPAAAGKVAAGSALCQARGVTPLLVLGTIRAG